MKIQLSDHFSYKKLLQFSLAPICSMIFTSLYGIVDGYFVSNYVGSTAFASLNLVMPFIMLLGGVGFMFGSGGNALVALHLGMKEKEKANRYFSMIIYTAMVVGILLGCLGYVLAPYVADLFNATAAMRPYCILYIRCTMFGAPFFMIQQMSQTFLITAEKPKLGFRITLVAGITNMIMDWLLVGVFRLGLGAAAMATVMGQIVGGLVPFILFIVKRNWNIHLGKTNFELRVIAKACGNGISEFVSNISMSVVGLLYNLQLLKYAGENGVSAYGVIMYVSFIFVAMYIGYTMGMSPIVSFNAGAENYDELKSVYRKSRNIIIITNLAMFVISEVLAGVLSYIFVGYDAELYSLTVHGLRIYSISFLIMGLNIFGSAFFTALNNGKISAILSLSRTLVIEVIMIFLLPALFGVDGLWAVVFVAEGLAVILTITFLMKNGKRYGYK